VELPLEEFILTPTGQKARRCQHVGPKGQCGAPAVQGELLCWRHLPGRSPKPKAEKKRRRAQEALAKEVAAEVLEAAPSPPDRTTHGFYSEAGRRAIREIAQEILALEKDLDNTDRELAVLKAALVWLLGKAEDYQAKAERLSAVVDGLSAVSTDDIQALRVLGEDLRLALRLQEDLRGWTDRLMEAAMRVINAAKQRAETRAKLAEAKALEQFVRLVQAVRDILWDLVPEEVLDAFEERLQREVLEAARVSLPPLPKPP
jgi:hypothetical protein